MEMVYEIAGISRQGHYSNNKRMERNSVEQEAVLAEVRNLRLSHPNMGSRPMYKRLDVQSMGINKFEKMLKSKGLGIKIKRNKHKTTDGSKYKGKLYNLLNGKIINSINQVWVSDITYFQVNGKTFYIILIMDIYSRKILGYSISENMFSENNIAVLKQALKHRGQTSYANNLIHHSDKGSQYMSLAYKELLSDFEIMISVAENSLENGYAEKLNSTVKNDYLCFYATDNLKMLRKYLRHCVRLYNDERPHSSLNYLTPSQFEDMLQGKSGKQMKLYDFTQKPINEFYKGIQQSEYLMKKGSEEPDFPTAQSYSSNGCSPAEPFSASLCDANVNKNNK